MRFAVIFVGVALSSCTVGARLAVAPQQAAACSDDPTGAVRAILADVGLESLSTAFSADEVTRQTHTPGGKVCFERAARLAVEALAMNGRSDESPLEVARRLANHRVCAHHEAPRAVFCYMNQPSSILGLAPMAPASDPGERATRSWIFWLIMPELSADVFWAHVQADSDRRVTIRRTRCAQPASFACATARIGALHPPRRAALRQ